MFKVPCDPRIASVGRILRRYSLDELPQSYDILKPAPGRDARLTGLWRVSGRAELM